MYKPVKTKPSSSRSGFQFLIVAALLIAPCLAAALMLAPGFKFQFNGFNFQGEQAQKSETGVVTNGITEIVILNKHGNVDLSHQSELNWKWDLTTWADTKEEAELFLDLIKMNVSEADGKQTWELVFPDDMTHSNGVESNLTVGVPSTVNVVITNQFGDTQLSNVSGGVKINSRHGDVTNQNTSGAIEIDNQHGDITLTKVGSVNLTSRHGDVKITDSIGEVIVGSKHGEVVANAIGGSIEVNSEHGECNLAGIMGDARVDVRYGDIELECNGNVVHCEHHHGDSEIVILNRAAISVDINGHHGGIELMLHESLRPRISATVTHGNVHDEFESNSTSDLNVNLKTSFEDIRVRKHSKPEMAKTVSTNSSEESL